MSSLSSACAILFLHRQHLRLDHRPRDQEARFTARRSFHHPQTCRTHRRRRCHGRGTKGLCRILRNARLSKFPCFPCFRGVPRRHVIARRHVMKSAEPSVLAALFIAPTVGRTDSDLAKGKLKPTEYCLSAIRKK